MSGMTEEVRQINAGFPPKLIDPLFGVKRRTVVLYGGRAGGKSWAVARALLIRGMSQPMRVLCCREYMANMADSVHRLLSDQIAIMGLESSYTIEKQAIYGPIFNNIRNEFRFTGIRNNPQGLKSYEGFDVAWVEEAANVSKDSWEKLIPTIRKPNSQIIVVFNPELEQNETYQRYVINPPPDSVVVKINYLDNPFIMDMEDGAVMLAEAEHMKKTDPDGYSNVWLGFPKTFLDQAIYSNELRQMQFDHRICKVPYVQGFPVHTFWDLGWADNTSIIFAQKIGFEYRIIDFLEGNHKNTVDWLRELQSKPYTYGIDWLPHDAMAKEKGSGKSIEDIMRAHGRTVRVVPRLTIDAGINAARVMFPSILIDEKCKSLIDSLRKYVWDLRGVTPKPLHDVNSHAADAFRYFCLSMREPKKVVLATPSSTGNRFRNEQNGWMR